MHPKITVSLQNSVVYAFQNRVNAGLHCFYVNMAIVQVFKNVIRHTSPGRYKDECSKITKPDDNGFFHVSLFNIHRVKCIYLWPIYINLI